MTNRAVDEVEWVPATPSWWTSLFPSHSVAPLPVPQAQGPLPRLAHLFPEAPIRAPPGPRTERPEGVTGPALSLSLSPHAVVCPE